MSILHFDSFDGDGHTLGKYTLWNVNNDIEAVRDGNGVKLGDANTFECFRVDVAANPTIIIGFTFRHDIQANNNVDNVRLQEGATGHISINFHGISGQIQLERGTTQIDISPVGSFVRGVLHHFEMKTFINDTTGTVEVKIDGTTVVNFGTGDTRNGGAVGTIDRISMGANSGTPLRIDNLVIMDDQGGLNDDFIGDVVIEARVPDGNGNYSQWDGSDGNQVDNYLQVDEGPPHDGDTTYNNAQVAAEKDTYTVEDLVATTGSVLAVQGGIIARHEGAGGTLRQMLRRSSTDQFGSAVTPGSGFTYHNELWEEDPNAGPGAWTITNVDATEFGVDLVS